MRFSYAWEVTPSQLADVKVSDMARWKGRYIHLRGIVSRQARVPEWKMTVVGVRDATQERFRAMALVPFATIPSRNEAVILGGRLWKGKDYLTTCRGELLWGKVVAPGNTPPSAATMELEDKTQDAICGLIVVSRFHGASVAGLVVGAMGCFIFGLYLRAWLRERKALASEPPGDMIA
jgi:hypothetical protein